MLTFISKMTQVVYFILEPVTKSTLGYLCPDLVWKLKDKDGILLNWWYLC